MNVSGGKFVDDLRHHMDRKAGILRAQKPRTLLILAGAICFPAKGVEFFLVFDMFADRMRDGRGEITAAEWWTAFGLSLAIVVALTVSVHLMLDRMSARAKVLLVCCMGVFALIAVGANPIAVSDPGQMLGQNSFEAAPEAEGVVPWIFWLAEGARLPVYVIAALVAGLGLGWLIDGMKALSAVRTARAELAESKRILTGFTEGRHEAGAWESDRRHQEDQMRLSIATMVSARAMDEALKAEAYISGIVISEETYAEQAGLLYARTREARNPELLDIVDALAPVPLNYAALPADGTSLPDTARSELTAFAAYLRQHYSTATILEEL